MYGVFFIPLWWSFRRKHNCHSWVCIPTFIQLLLMDLPGKRHILILKLELKWAFLFHKADEGAQKTLKPAGRAGAAQAPIYTATIISAASKRHHFLTICYASVVTPLQNTSSRHYSCGEKKISFSIHIYQ